MTKSIILKRSKEFGLNKYETRSYLALLERDTLPVTEIAKLAGIPRTAAYEALENLLKKGFCVAKPGKVKQYSAIDPVLLKEKVLGELNDSFEARLLEINAKRDELLAQKELAKKNFNELYQEIKPLFKNSRSNDTPLDYIEIIKDPYQIHKKLIDLANKAKKEILVFTKPPYAIPKDLIDEQGESDAESLNRGISIRAIYEVPKDQNESDWLFRFISSVVKSGEQARVIDALPLKMVIYDEKTVLFPLEDPVVAGTSFTTQVIEHSPLAIGLKVFFNMMWEKSQDFQAYKECLKAK